MQADHTHADPNKIHIKMFAFNGKLMESKGHIIFILGFFTTTSSGLQI